MNNNISNNLLAKLSELINIQMGLYFPERNWRNLKRGLGFAASEFDFEDTESFGQWLLSAPLTQDRIHRLACHLTIGETYFFREMNVFEAFREHVLAELLFSRKETDRRLRIWSAGCSSGEEPYSIAILLTRMIPDIERWNITILATDVNPRSLQKAETGTYTDWSFRKPPPWLKNQYFKKTGKEFTILPNIKRMVTFSSLNLAEDVYPSLTNNTNAMDIIFCRNVIMYFSDTLRKRVIQKFHHALVDGGWLIVSPSEAYSALFPQYITVNFLGSTFFLKNPKPKELRQLWFARTFGFNESSPLSQPSTGIDGQSEIASGYPNHVSSQQYATPPGSFGGDLSQGGIVPLKSSLTNTSIGLEKDNINNPAFSTQPPGQESQSAAYEEALTLYEQGHYKEVTEKLLVLTTLSANEQATELLTRAYANQGDLDKALEWCEKAIAIDKLNPGFHYLRATILQEQGHFDEAIGSFRRTLYLDPNFVLAYFALGSIAAQQGKIKESKKHLNNAQRLLQSYDSEDVLPESDGMTTGRLREIVNTMLLVTV